MAAGEWQAEALGLETQYTITATGTPQRGRHTLKNNDTTLVIDTHGDIGTVNAGFDGLLHADTRHLSSFELLIGGVPPLRLGSSVDDASLMVQADLTNPDLFRDGQLVIPKDTIHIARSVFVSDRAMHVRLSFMNHGTERFRAPAAIVFDSDFADLFEVRGMRRELRGTVSREVLSSKQVIMRYVGLDGRPRETSLAFEPAPFALSTSSAVHILDLPPQAFVRVFIEVACEARPQRPAQAFLSGVRSTRVRHRRMTSKAAVVECGDQLLSEILSRAFSDIYMLVTETPEGPYPYAGIPWYSTTFGRDGIITALAMLPFDPSIAAGVLRRLARLQGVSIDPSADCEPGKIIHEMRQGEMAALGEVPFGRYYGSVDSTPLFIMLASRYLARTGDVQLARELWPAVCRALEWLDEYGDPQQSGFVTYPGHSSTGLSNQCWRDSVDSVFHEDGTLAKGPIAAVEVQGYVYEARLGAATIACLLGEARQAAALESEAEELRLRFEDAFWCEAIGTYALALDGEGRQCRVRSSNAGHTLFTGIASRERAWRTARMLMSQNFHSGWGIRTIARGAARYNPMSYHNGSIWPHDNAMIAAGFSRYGFGADAEAIFHAMMDAASYMEERRLPELFCGFARQRDRGPTLYPVACSPQAWASAAPFLLISSLIGLEFDPGPRRIVLDAPRLPEGIDRLTLRRISIGGASVDLRLHRTEKGRASLEVLSSNGEINVTVRQ